MLVENPERFDSIAIPLRAADVVRLRPSRGRTRSRSRSGRAGLLIYASADWDDDGFRENFTRLLDGHPTVLDDLARHDRSR
jgi:hypothetical protein